MNHKGYSTIPGALFNAITFFCQSLPKRSVPTFPELLFGAMLTQTGFVTDAVLAVATVRHWNSYCKWLHFGRRRYLSVSYAIPQLLVLLDDAKVTHPASFAPWRLKQPVTVIRGTARRAPTCGMLPEYQPIAVNPAQYDKTDPLRLLNRLPWSPLPIGS